VSRATAAGAQLRTGARVEHVVVSGGRAIGAIAADGTAVRARRAVLADVDVVQLYRRLLPEGALPPRLLRELDRFQRDLPTVKLDWALDGPVPWRAAGAAGAGTVHVGADVAGLADWSTALATGRPSRHDFALVGQMATADPSRAPAGGQSMWAYSHLPAGEVSADAAQALAERLEQLLEACAPGMRDLVVDRTVQLPRDLQAGDANLVDGTVNGGTAQLQQQLIFRPVPGLARPETPVARLYLASASAHPGGGVHGAAGHNAARAALLSARFGGVPGAVLSRLSAALAGGGRLPEL
jgi:phytoene dehydrogenase-like protein